MTSVVLFNLKDQFRPVRPSLCTSVRDHRGASVPAQQGLLAAVEVVKLLLGHGIAHVDSRKAQLTCL